MGVSNKNPERSTFQGRGSALDFAIEEIYGRPQNSENFVARPGEIRKALGVPVGREYRFVDSYLRKRLGIESSQWFGRVGVHIDDLEPFMWELANHYGKKNARNRSGQYAALFYQAAVDLGDDAIPFTAANRLLGRKDRLRWHNDGIKEDEIYPYHPQMEAYRDLLRTTFTTRKAVEELYERAIGLPDLSTEVG